MNKEIINIPLTEHQYTYLGYQCSFCAYNIEQLVTREMASKEGFKRILNRKCTYCRTNKYMKMYIVIK